MKSWYPLAASLAAVLCISSVSYGQVRTDRALVWKSIPSPSVDVTPPHFPTGSQNRILAIDTSLKSRIIANLEAVYQTADPDGRHGIAGSVIAPRLGQINFAIGTNAEDEPMRDTLAFEIGSNTKTFIAALIMKLQEQGKLSIKDSLHSWLPSFPNVDSNITIKQLLEHSSGIYDYLNDDPFGTVLNAAYVGDPEHLWTPEEILQDHVGAPNFKPGTSYRYSNTNFILLGMIAARATGLTAAQAIHQYLIDTLRLDQICPAWEDSLMEPIAHQWFPMSGYPSSDFYEIPKRAQLSAAHTAGGIVATASQLARWSQALYLGEVVSSNSLKQMEVWHTWPDRTVYGLGTMKIPYYTHTFVGHGGHLLGFSSDMATNPSDSVTFVLFTNYDVVSGDKSLNDYAIAVLDAIYAPVQSVGSGADREISVSAWPNPATLAIAFRSDAPGPIRYTLTDDLGREVGEVTGSVTGAPVLLDVRGLAAGTYHYRAAGPGLEHFGSVVVQH